MTHLPDVNWDNYLLEFSPELADAICRYVTYRSRSWREDDRIHHSRSLLSGLSIFFRSMKLTCVQGVTPKLWFAHVEERMKADVQPSSLNTTLRNIQSFLRYVKNDGVPICETMLEVHVLKTGERLPRDLTVSQIKTLLQIVSVSMDRAWIILMLHSGLRTCEVRSLRWCNVDLQAHTLRIHESKGLRSRVFFISSQSIQVLNNLPKDSEYVFTYRNQPLGYRYCQSRLTTMGRQCEFHITPHQLRHSCATLLLNAGAPVLSVQSLLGHEKLDTTLGYARLYDGTVAADYYRAMAQVEDLFGLHEKRKVQFTPVEMVALLDSLSRGTLNESQRETVYSLRQGMLALAQVSV